MYCVKTSINNKKVAIIGTGYISQYSIRPENLPSLLPKLDLKSSRINIGELFPKDIIKKYANLSNYVKYGYLAALKACSNILIECPEQWGIYCGTGLGGSPEVYIKQCKMYYEKGLSWMLPSMVMNKVAKTIADVLSIECQIKGKSYTAIAGRTSAGIVLMQAYDDIINGEISHALAVSAEHIDEYILEAYARIDYPEEKLCSGAGALVLSSIETVKSNNIYAYLVSCESNSIYMDVINPDLEMLAEEVDIIIRKALYKANIAFNDVDGIIYARTYHKEADTSVINTLKKMFSTYTSSLFCVTDYLGDMLGANALLAILLSISVMKGSISNTKQLKHKKNFLGLVYGLNGQICAFVIENANV